MKFMDSFTERHQQVAEDYSNLNKFTSTALAYTSVEHMYWSDPPDKEDQTEHTDNKEYDRFATSGKMLQTVINLGKMKPVLRTSRKSGQVGCKLTLKMLGKNEPGDGLASRQSYQ